jgi:hypothetical protein
MPIQTDLSVSPYFDDYDANKDYYKVLFRPGVAVQARELNQLQTILQKQIERFGDNIFKRGTIVDGCQIVYDNNVSYVKIKDSQTDGAPVNVNQLYGYYLKDTADVRPLIASVQTVIDGYESKNPDLKTIYINYINSGQTSGGERQTFIENDNLTVYRADYPVESIKIVAASNGFSNSDSVVISPAIAVQNSTGGTTFANNFYVGQYLTDGTANAVIEVVDTTSNSEAVLLKIKPKATDLTGANTAKWTFYSNTTVQGIDHETEADSDQVTVVGIVGSGASAILRTGTIEGEAKIITVTQKGTGYYVTPTVSIRSGTATSTSIGNANLVAYNELTTISVANSSITDNPTGHGYSVVVGDGVIYQKGYFSRVNQHRVIVEKYSNTGFNKAVGFDTTESIVDSNIDVSLLDNATGEPNYTAPGANRLQLSPTLVVKTLAEADANTDFFSVVEFSDGRPYKQNSRTVYNILGDEMATRTYEESGNYVIDPFIINTKHAATLSDEQTKFKVLIDPGVAYIKGKRVETVENHYQDVDKGTDTITSNNATVSLEYGNYIRVKELGGIFEFDVGALVNLYSANTTGYASKFISSGNAGTTPAAPASTTLLGTARIRSLVRESGVPGTAECIYRLYLFDINLATARNATLIRSIFYNGSTYKGICDAVLEGGKASIKDNDFSSLLFSAGRPAVKTGSGFNYTYRTVDTANAFNIAANGTITIGLSGGETFPYAASSTLAPNQEDDIVVTPVANVQNSANASGSVSCNATSTQVNGSSTSFTTQFEAGDYIKIGSGGTAIVRQIAAIANDTILTLTTNGTSQSAANLVMYFPQYVPISLRGDRSANVNSDANSMIIDLGASVNVATNIAVTYNAITSGTTAVSKGVARDKYVRLDLSAGNTGPWCLGVGDVFHLKGVFKGANNTFAEDASGIDDITNEYYVDHNQNEDYYGLSYLYRKTSANTAVTTSNSLLVKFDYFTHSGEGLKAPGASGTYPINDGITLASSSSTINTLEIPEMYGAKGDYYDLRDYFDFRPLAANTVTPVSVASVASAPINPSAGTSSTRFSAGDKKFPAPNGSMSSDLEFYVGRVDRIIINNDGNFDVLRGVPGSGDAPEEPQDAMTISVLNIAPYPSQPQKMSSSTVEFVDRKMVNETRAVQRLDNYRVVSPISKQQRSLLQPRGYTMVDIGSLERRIEALEYYTSFTLVEALTTKKTIPSSANTAMGRFKFGFFVDGFNNYDYSETQNPLYNASIVDGLLSPRAIETSIVLEPDGGVTTLPWVEKRFIRQPDATDGPVVTVTPPGNTDPTTGTVTVTPVSNTESNTVTTPTVTVITQTAYGREKNTNRSDAGYIYDDYYYTFSASSGTARFFINSRDNNIGTVVWQSQTKDGPWTTEVINSGTSGTAITSSDITTYGLRGLNDGRKIEHPGSQEIKSYYYRGTERWIEDHFKLTWTHNPSNGIYYKVRVYKGENHGAHGKKGTYGFKLLYPFDQIGTPPTFVNGLSSSLGYAVSNYPGTLSIGGIDATGLALAGFGLGPVGYVNIAGLNGYNYAPFTPNVTPDTNVIAEDQAFVIRCTGLRPSTSHKLYVDGVDKTSVCKQDGKLLGAGLDTDSNGELVFTYHYYPTIETVNETTGGAAKTEMKASTLSIKITDTSEKSTASSQITVQNYIKHIIKTGTVATPTTIPPALVPAIASTTGPSASDIISAAGISRDLFSPFKNFRF